MRRYQIFVALMLGLGFTVAGCGKNNMDQASLTGTGTESFDQTEQLAQFPQASAVSQQNSIEVLPIETSPVTPGLPVTMGGPGAAFQTQAPVTPDSLNYNQRIQTALKNAGFYNGAIDGKIGPKTRAAIQSFQANNSLKADGKVGPKTWEALEPYLSASSTAAGVSQTSLQ